MELYGLQRGPDALIWPGGRLSKLLLLLIATFVLGTSVAHAEEPKAVCSAATETTVECLSVFVPEGAFPSYQGSGEKGGFAPKDLRSAYKLPSTGGTGQTIAIVDAFDDPNAESDLKTYRSHYGLSECTTANGCFSKVNQKGEAKNYPAGNSGWSLEISLDLDMASAICPACHIILVEATSNSFENMASAEDEAATLKATEISDSWGGGDISARVAEDSHYSHPGIPILVAAGDSGYGTEFPASVPTVISVGGTSLKTAANSREWSETVWSGTNSGCSPVQSKPSWQTDKGCTKRTDNDIAAVASPETPLSVYDSYVYPGWVLVGGTSASTPIMAGVEALSSSTARSLGAEAFWKAGPKAAFFDVTEGSNGSCATEVKYLCSAQIGYDGPTGWGTPDGVIAISTATELSGMAVTEPFNGSETSKANYAANWSTLGWATEKGNDSLSGWRPNHAWPAVNGTFDTATVTDLGSGVAAVVTMAEEPLNSERYFSLWLDASGASGARTGYELRFTAASSGGPGYEVTLSKWQEGTQTVLASHAHHNTFPIGSSLALVDQGSTVSGWTNTGTEFSELLSASDSVFKSGNAGMEGAGNRTKLTNFKEGVL